jgi:hypothetical protein
MQREGLDGAILAAGLMLVDLPELLMGWVPEVRPSVAIKPVYAIRQPGVLTGWKPAPPETG